MSYQMVNAVISLYMPRRERITLMVETKSGSPSRSRLRTPIASLPERVTPRCTGSPGFYFPDFLGNNPTAGCLLRSAKVDADRDRNSEKATFP